MLVIKKSNGKEIAKISRICNSVLEKSIGLRFNRIKSDEAFVFVFEKPRIMFMDMWFVFHPIDVLFLDERKKVVEIKENFLPFSFYKSKEKAKYVVELDSGVVQENSIAVGNVLRIGL